MIALSYILTAIGGVLVGVLLPRQRYGHRKAAEPQLAKSPYAIIPAAAAYERYAAKVEGREPSVALIDSKPAPNENPFFAGFRRAWHDRQGL